MNRIEQIATTAGAERARAQRPNEIASVERDRDGRLIVTLANGDRHKIVRAADVPPEERRGCMVDVDLMHRFFPEFALNGWLLPIGVPFYPRHRIVCGTRFCEFMEAGR